MNKWYFALLGIISILVATAGILDSINTGNDASIMAWQKVETAYLQRTELLESYLSKAKEKNSNSDEIIALSESYEAVKNLAAYDFTKNSDLTVFKEKQEALTSALAKLVVSQEIYPELMKDPGFRDIHAKLDEAEYRISVSTAKYNRTVHEQEIIKQRLTYRIANILNSSTDKGSNTPTGKTGVVLILNKADYYAPVEKEASQKITVAAN